MPDLLLTRKEGLIYMLMLALITLLIVTIDLTSAPNVVAMPTTAMTGVSRRHRICVAHANRSRMRPLGEK